MLAGGFGCTISPHGTLFSEEKEGTFTGDTVALNLSGNLAHDALWNQ